MDNPRILIAAGGTGGHVYPAISIADAIRSEHQNAEILFVGTKNHMEWTAVPKAGYEIVNVWISGFHRRLTLKNLLFPFKLITSLIQSANILRKFRPQVTVSCGGYVAGPVGWVAAKSGIPIVIQEQNSYPGVTNRMLAKDAEKIFTAFEGASKYFPKEKIQLSGNPVRSVLRSADKKEALKSLNFISDKPVLLILGGSGGARSINQAMLENITSLHDELGLQILWQCGPRYYEGLSAEMDLNKLENLKLTPYIDKMPEAYAAADLVISRAGASSCSELMMTGKPSVLVPSPNVAGDHQTENAKSMVEAGASELLPDEKMKDVLVDLVKELIHDQEKLKKMNQAALKLAKPDAAKEIAREILNIAKTRLN
ncbi:undecaprenyldiphospho-muramoylpentapeptide beta-N-acetylglucosaminyltransferase [Balneola sp. MJW-20]|uniref:undecaprenyldiphospho-muramoylpentapeptide beta-N-acetylglucosaminyltransferase n=1 Tax=Gracilimonas aurantiaca TaxID=3234185 RepID=UPI003467AFF4